VLDITISKEIIMAQMGKEDSSALDRITGNGTESFRLTMLKDPSPYFEHSLSDNPLFPNQVYGKAQFFLCNLSTSPF
jgi:hypothetical protein